MATPSTALPGPSRGARPTRNTRPEQLPGRPTGGHIIHSVQPREQESEGMARFRRSAGNK